MTDPDVTTVPAQDEGTLEAQGLVTPRRTASGYRSFDAKDVQRLRYYDRWPLLR